MPIDGTISRFSEGTNKLLRRESLEPPMSQLGQRRKWLRLNGTSVLPSRADIVRLPRHVRFVPISEVATLIRSARRQAPAMWVAQ
jgi:hypothetical protein